MQARQSHSQTKVNWKSVWAGTAGKCLTLCIGPGMSARQRLSLNNLFYYFKCSVLKNNYTSCISWSFSFIHRYSVGVNCWVSTPTCIRIIYSINKYLNKLFKLIF